MIIWFRHTWAKFLTERIEIKKNALNGKGLEVWTNSTVSATNKVLISVEMSGAAGVFV